MTYYVRVSGVTKSKRKLLFAALIKTSMQNRKTSSAEKFYQAYKESYPGELCIFLSTYGGYSYGTHTIAETREYASDYKEVVAIYDNKIGGKLNAKKKN